MNSSAAGEQEALLRAWYKRVTLSSQSHYGTATGFALQNKIVGLFSILLSGVVGTSLLTTMSQGPADLRRIIQGIVSYGAAVLAGWQTFMKLTERAEMHRNYGASYGRLRRALEDALRRVHAGPLSEPEIKRITDTWDLLASHAPAIPNRIWSATKDRYGARLDADFPSIAGAASGLSPLNGGPSHEGPIQSADLR